MGVAMEPAGYVHDETHYTPPSTLAAKGPKVTNERPAVFVVHGHDHAMRDKLVAFLRKQSSFETIVLEEEANRGKTIIEKFEAHTHRARFALVIATPDDVGCTAAELVEWDPLAKEHLLADLTKRRSKSLDELEFVPPPVRPRARQNVVLEWGYFAGKLGRDNVMIVKTGDVELPSDLRGILETRGNFELALLRELKAAGLDVDVT
jgi:predicted nucleotide-binding protein